MKLRTYASTAALSVAVAIAFNAHSGSVAAASLKDFDDPSPAEIWTGLYIGVHGGYADGDWDGRLATTAGDPPPDDAGFSDPTQSIDGDGWLGGGQIGYNLQRGQFVLGVEADISGTDFEGSGTFTAFEDGVDNAWRKDHDLELDYFGTARLRAGFAAANWLFYATGGLAWGETSGNLAVTQFDEVTGDEAGTSFADTEETHVGWTAGVGVEVLADSNWSLKAEWLYVDLGEEDYLFTGETFSGDPFDTDSFESDLTFNVFRIGVNYKFH